MTNIQRVLTGREALPLDSLRLATVDTQRSPEEMRELEHSDSLLRAQVELVDATLEAQPVPEKIEALKDIPFKRPFKATLREGFRPGGSHAYVELTAPSGTTFAAILDGTIVSAEWSELEGCTLRMQHDNDLVSIYRHAGKLTKSVGEQVKAGTTLGVIGDTGELSAHLLLEIRYKNQPVDPALYIAF